MRRRNDLSVAVNSMSTFIGQVVNLTRVARLDRIATVASMVQTPLKLPRRFDEISLQSPDVSVGDPGAQTTYGPVARGE